ncbi:MAG TPA: hypothetical protein VJ885_04465 [Thermoanaerobaculia bacterium]|nr:hypothetical protein [Thermoanaerobaculia bacterium]
MKRGGCIALGCAGAAVIFALALAGIVLLWAFAPEAEQAEDVHVDLNETREEGEARFERSAAGDRFRLSFGFIDHDGDRHQVACTIRREDYEREVARFGYSEAERSETLNREVKALLEREAAARGVAPYFTIEVHGDLEYEWSYEVPPMAGPEALQAAEELHQWLDTRSGDAIAPLIDRYYRERGFALEKNMLQVDYERAVLESSDPLADCFEALRRAGGQEPAVRQLGLFLSFFQDLRYELPPDVDEQGRETLGFRVPTAVLVRGAGDCDSKAAAFCSMWRRLRGSRVLLILVPEHALVGVEGKPGPDQAFVRLGNRYFILCEVAGPGKIPAGDTSIEGSFEYILIEPGD